MLVATCRDCDYESAEAATEKELKDIVAKEGGDLDIQECPYCGGELVIVDTSADLK